jgi:spermidine synthase
MSKRPSNRRELDSPWLLGAGSVRKFLPERDEARRGRKRPFILETDSERHLLFSHDSVQSSMCLDEPDALTSEYTRRMMSFLLFNPQPEHVLMVGLGGGSIAKFCHRYLPGTRMTAVEIDEDVIALRDEFCLPFDDERLRVVHADGVRFIAQSDEQFDIILTDAFDHQGVAPALAVSDFYRDAYKRLNDDGVFVLNLSGDPSRYDAHLQCIYEAFGARTALMPVNAGDNELLFAFKRDFDFSAPESDELARELEQALTLDFPRYRRLLLAAMRA